MRVDLIKWEGFPLAIVGAMLSKGKVSYERLVDAKGDVYQGSIAKRVLPLARKLAEADGGHNKFLEQVQYWLAIEAPLYFWKQFDTYRIGISKSSESTMFKMWNKGVTQKSFENPVYEETLKRLNEDIQAYNKKPSGELFYRIINNLPDGFLQTRLVNINAKALRNMYFQRKTHKLAEWRGFCKKVTELPLGDLITRERE